MTSLLLQDTPVEARRRFFGGVSALVGASNVKAFYMPGPTEGLTVSDPAVTSRVWTNANTPNGRISALGRASALAMNGSSDMLTAPDATDLSFGDGATDTPFSMVVVANVTDTAAVRAFFGKNGEYAFSLDQNDKLFVQLVDLSVPAIPSRLQDVATTRQGSWAMYGFTYTKATGGATAANDITIYENGLVVASTATNVGTYVAMENGTSLPTIGALNAGAGAGWLPGTLALMLCVGVALTATQHAALRDQAQTFLGVRL